MPKMTTPLTDTAIRKAKAQDKVVKLSDGNNLYLVIRPSGTKFFRFDYRFADKRQSISLGTYPSTTLKEAREKAIQAKERLKDGINPALAKNPILNSFEAIAEKWLNIMESEWSAITLAKTRSRLVQHVFPAIGNTDIKEITRLDILNIVGAMQQKEIFELTSRILNNIERIYKYAVTYGYVEHNIVGDIDKRSALKRKEVRHVAALTNEKDIKSLMDDIKIFERDSRADISTIFALKLAPFVFLRPYNLRYLEWNEINFEKEFLDIPAKKMKMKQDFILPLSKQALDVINAIKPYSFERSKYVFPSAITSTKAMSENTLNYAIIRMGWKDKMTSHGFRSMFSTIAHEKISEHGFHSDIIEVCLAHAEQNKVKAAYNRTNKMKYFEEKKALVQWWADWLE